MGKDGKATTFAEGLDDPKGIVAWTNMLFVADNKRVVKIDPKGKVSVLAGEKAFPIPPLFLNDITVDELGVVYVSDSGDLKGNGGAVFRIDQKGKVTLVTDGASREHHASRRRMASSWTARAICSCSISAPANCSRSVAVKDGKSEKVADGSSTAASRAGVGPVWTTVRPSRAGRPGQGLGIPRPKASRPILLAEELRVRRRPVHRRSDRPVPCSSPT